MIILKKLSFIKNYSSDINLKLNNFIKKYKNIFILEEIIKYSQKDISESFFHEGVSPNIDIIQEKINNGKNFINILASELSKYIDDKNIFSSKDDSNKKFIKVEYKEKDGHYLVLTKRRLELLKKGLEKKKIKSIMINETKILIKDLDFRPFPKSSNVKIYLDDINTQSNNIIIYQEKIKGLVKEKYLEILEKMFIENNNLFLELVDIISRLDFLKSGAKIAKLYNYNKPIIENEENNNSYFKSIGIRHPIIERLNNDTEYITNDILLGTKYKDSNLAIFYYMV